MFRTLAAQRYHHIALADDPPSHEWRWHRCRFAALHLLGQVIFRIRSRA